MPRAQRSTMDELPSQGGDELPPQSGEIVGPLDPNERLKELQAELTQHNSRIDHLSKQRDVLETDINGLAATVQQVRTTVTSYGVEQRDLHNRLQALEYFYHQKNKMVLAAIGERKFPIDDLIRGYDEETARMQGHLRELSEKQIVASDESMQAAHLQDNLQKEYDTVTGYQQGVTNKLTEMEALRAEITQADDATDAASMYFLILQFHFQLRETKIVSQHELSLELRQKLGELEIAKERARAKSASLSVAQAEYTAYKTEVDTKLDDRSANLLAEVKALFPVPSEPGPSDALTPATMTPPTSPDNLISPAPVQAANPGQ